MESKKPLRVGRHVFSGCNFLVTSVAGLVFALTAGAFLPAATSASTWTELMYSGQSLTLVLLLGLSWFVREGVKNSHYREAVPFISFCAVITVIIHAVGKFGPLLWPL